MSIVSKFVFEESSKIETGGSFNWESPSNIALVKYWGKKPNQIPANPSISFTLSNCKTITSLEYHVSRTGENNISVFLDGQPKEDFVPKIRTFLDRIEAYVPFVKELSFVIKTKNTFPHSSGIASSASGMSALALCIMSIEKELNPGMDDDYFNEKASFLARLGSGSASRSIQGPIVSWGMHKNLEGSSDLFGSKYSCEVHDNFRNYQDTILLIDEGEKQVSSTVGHNLMHDHSYAESRFQQAHENIDKLKEVFKTGDLDSFINIVESEALTLHAMMMCSNPYFILMKPNTLEVINRIWAHRRETGSKVCFTLDAGANVHMLYPSSEKENIKHFINTELVGFCQNAHYICDNLGLGAKQL